MAKKKEEKLSDILVGWTSGRKLTDDLAALVCEMRREWIMSIVKKANLSEAFSKRLVLRAETKYADLSTIEKNVLTSLVHTYLQPVAVQIAIGQTAADRLGEVLSRVIKALKRWAQTRQKGWIQANDILKKVDRMLHPEKKPEKKRVKVVDKPTSKK